MELVPVPELDRRQSQRQTIASDSEAGVHQYAATGVILRPPLASVARC